MRKLLILMLVLGIASTASAGTMTGTISYVPASTSAFALDVVNVDVVATVTGVDIQMLMDLVTSLSGNVGSFSTGNFAANSIFTGTNLVTLADTDLNVNPPGPYASAAGVTLFSFDVTVGGGALVGDSLTMSLGGLTTMMSSTGQWLQLVDITPTSGTITVIPEPMTIVLLGLGGLFLRRRRVA